MGRIFLLILVHTFADFFLQGRKLSILKSIKLPYLIEHVSIYTLVFIILSPIVLGLRPLQGLLFSLINGVLHLSVDYITGKFKLQYRLVDENKYLQVIGLDHTVHIIILIFTYVYFFHGAMDSSYGLIFN